MSLSIQQYTRGTVRVSSCLVCHGRYWRWLYPPENLADQLENHTGIRKPESSQHTKRQLKLSNKWKDCIPSAFKAVVEGESMKDDVVCTNCGAPANVRCRQCGPYVFFCSDCGVSFHSRWNYHHYPEMWKVWDITCTSCSTECSTVLCYSKEGSYSWVCQHQVLQRISVTVMHIGLSHVFMRKVKVCGTFNNIAILLKTMELGTLRKLRISFWHCESDIVIFVHLNYWLATPSHPSIAFSFSSLDWLQALLLECQVPVQDFFSALAFIITTKYEKVCMTCDFFQLL